MKEELKKYLETNDNENPMTQNLWNEAKAIPLYCLQQYDPTSRNKKHLK